MMSAGVVGGLEKEVIRVEQGKCANYTPGVVDIEIKLS